MNSARNYSGLRAIVSQVSSDKDSSQSVMMKTHVHLDSDTCRADKVLAQGRRNSHKVPTFPPPSLLRIFWESCSNINFI